LISKRSCLSCVLTCLLLCGMAANVALAAEPEGDAADSGSGAKPASGAAAHGAKEHAESSATRHSVTIGGKTISYTATAGTLILRDDADEPTAAVGYVAYTLRDVADLTHRPVTFAYNGGPGSSSIWLHMGALGPRRIVTTEGAATPPAPYRVVDNAYSVLDKTDLVMIDPVGTGISRALGKKKDKDFWGVDQDIEEMSRFIKQYASDNHRWTSPKYLLGESYGTTRSAGIVEYLQTRENMALNGVILVSVALDIEAIFSWTGNDRPYPLFLPSFAAVAAYHHALPHPPVQLDSFLDEVRRYARGDYAAALARGDALSAAERDAVAARLHEYTGLSVDYIKLANLRVREPQFTQELLREHHETVGRLDARFRGVTFDPLAEDAQYDPQAAAISSAYTAAFLDYYHGDLNFGHGRNYIITSREAFPAWDWKHRAPGGGLPIPFPNTVPDLAHAIGFNPHLRVLVLNGLYDLATPFMATEEMMDHLNLEPELRSHVQMKYYPAGHMMYVNEASLQQMKADIAAFIDATTHP
jgi:carboxypeptidase C (cathepsin A)